MTASFKWIACVCFVKMQLTDCSPDQSFGLSIHICAHSNLQCPSLPFQTTPHHYTCAKCICLVCKTSAVQCSSWGNGTKVRDNVNGSVAGSWHGSTPAAAHRSERTTPMPWLDMQCMPLLCSGTTTAMRTAIIPAGSRSLLPVAAGRQELAAASTQAVLMVQASPAAHHSPALTHSPPPLAR